MAASEQHEPAQDGSTEEPLFSYAVRRGIRQCSQDMHSKVVGRMRRAKCQGDVASPGRLVADVRAITGARSERARGAHGPSRQRITGQHVRDCYLELAATAVLLAEREVREPELPRGEKGGKKGAGSYAPLDFTVPAT